MKKLKFIPLLFLSLLLINCSKDDDSSSEQDQQEVNEQENVVLDANQVANGIIINGAAKISGNAPQPNGNISLSLNNSSSALLSEGYAIDFQSPNDIAGAYLVISDVDGNVASNYYDVPASAFGFTNDIDVDKKPFSIGHKKGGGLSINVGFDDSIPVGRFCYAICVYDDNGNISAPQAVCITIESWGGNSNLVGNWQLSRYIESYNNMNVDVGLNEEYCFDETLYCDNGSMLNYDYCSVWEGFSITLNENGTYTLYYKIRDNEVIYNAASCSITEYVDAFYEYTSNGFWAYNDTSQKLVFAEYAYLENENGTIYEENFGVGNAEIIFDDSITINGNTFTISFDDLDPGEQLSYTFQK